MMFFSIASGSSGNCIFVGDENAGVLVDVGISMKKVFLGLESAKLSIDCVKAIFITHEHSDHISGLGPLLRKVPIPVYATAGTVSAIWEKGNMKNISPDLFHSIRTDERIKVADLVVRAFSISHDAIDPVCYTIEKHEKKVGIATDMGCFDKYIIESLSDCKLLLLESNHDISLLEVGPYPYQLKLRILGEKGHLSNVACADLIKELIHDDLENIVLGHLSKENNFPELAYSTVKTELADYKPWREKNISLSVAKRFDPSDVIVI